MAIKCDGYFDKIDFRQKIDIMILKEIRIKTSKWKKSGIIHKGNKEKDKQRT